MASSPRWAWCPSAPAVAAEGIEAADARRVETGVDLDNSRVLVLLRCHCRPAGVQLALRSRGTQRQVVVRRAGLGEWLRAVGLRWSLVRKPRDQGHPARCSRLLPGI